MKKGYCLVKMILYISCLCNKTTSISSNITESITCFFLEHSLVGLHTITIILFYEHQLYYNSIVHREWNKTYYYLCTLKFKIN